MVQILFKLFVCLAFILSNLFFSGSSTFVYAADATLPPPTGGAAAPPPSITDPLKYDSRAASTEIEEPTDKGSASGQAASANVAGAAGSAVGSAVGGGLIGAGIPMLTDNEAVNNAMGSILVGFGVLATAGGAAMGATAQEAGGVAGQLGGGSGALGSSGFRGYDNSNTKDFKDAEKKANDALKLAAANGVTLDSKNGVVKTPRGNIPIKAFASVKSLVDGGYLNAEEGKELDAKIKKISDSLKPLNFAAGGGGGGGSASFKPTKLPDFNFGNNMNQERPREPATEGLTRSLATGESIGSSTDNIFEMIGRKYRQKNEEKIFVGQ